MKIILITKPEEEGVCPHCVMAKNALNDAGVLFQQMPIPYAARQDLYRGNPFNTVPQAYLVNNDGTSERIGGVDNLLTFLDCTDG